MADAKGISIQTRKKINLLPGLLEGYAKHDKFLFGNGEPGIDERMRNIEKWIELQIEKEKKKIAWWDRFQWVIIPIIITFTVGFIGQFIVFWIRVVPGLK